MQFLNILASFGFVALVAASPQATDSSVTSMVSTPTSASVSPTESCITACGTNVCCRAACVGVPCPNEAQANATTECAMQCDQGDGSPADTQAYGECQSSCIASLFLTSAGTAAATGTSRGVASNSASATGSSGTARASADSTASSSDSAAAASASSTGNAASSIQIGASTAGLLGLLMAALAL